MDYKYIEQLLERYWNCETSLEEEQILRTFFTQKEVPAHLARYRELFIYENAQQDVSLGKDFDEKLLAAAGIENETGKEDLRRTKAGRFTIAHRLRPLYRAAAAVAIITLLGTATQHSLQMEENRNNGGWDYNSAAYKDSYQDPQKAYEMGMEALELFKEGPSTAAADTLKPAPAEHANRAE
ncbi:MAG: hypothetical protein ACI3YC_00895 [Alloprevotella sp.]